jgi:hypothetical protein
MKILSATTNNTEMNFTTVFLLLILMLRPCLDFFGNLWDAAQPITRELPSMVANFYCRTGKF